MTPRRAGAVPALAGAALLLWGLAAALAPDADAQNPLQPDARFAGLQWTFARVRYQAWDVPASHGCDAYNDFDKYIQRRNPAGIKLGKFAREHELIGREALKNARSHLVLLIRIVTPD